MANIVKGHALTPRVAEIFAWIVENLKIDESFGKRCTEK